MPTTTNEKRNKLNFVSFSQNIGPSTQPGGQDEIGVEDGAPATLGSHTENHSTRTLGNARSFGENHGTTRVMASPAVTRARARARQIQERFTEQEEERRTEEVPLEVLCKVCYVSKRNTALIPCGHSFCQSCASRVQGDNGSCPVCKQKINSLLTLYD